VHALPRQTGAHVVVRFRELLFRYKHVFEALALEFLPRIEEEALEGRIGKTDAPMLVEDGDAQRTDFDQGVQIGRLLGKALLSALAVGDVEEAFQQVAAAAHFHRAYGLDDGALLAGKRQQQALGVVHRLAEVGDRAAARLCGAYKAMANRAGNLVDRCSHKGKGDGISVDDAVGFRIDDEDARLNAVEKSLEPVAHLPDRARALRVQAFGRGQRHQSADSVFGSGRRAGRRGGAAPRLSRDRGNGSRSSGGGGVGGIGRLRCRGRNGRGVERLVHGAPAPSPACPGHRASKAARHSA